MELRFGMDPFTLAVAGALVTMLKRHSDRRYRDEEEEHDALLLDWDDALREFDGLPGIRIPWAPGLKEALLFRDNEECAHKSSYCRGAFTIDHVISLNDRGQNFSDNLSIVCSRHNSSKRERSRLEFKYGISRRRS